MTKIKRILLEKCAKFNNEGNMFIDMAMKKDLSNRLFQVCSVFNLFAYLGEGDGCVAVPTRARERLHEAIEASGPLAEAGSAERA